MLLRKSHEEFETLLLNLLVFLTRCKLIFILKSFPLLLKKVYNCHLQLLMDF